MLVRLITYKILLNALICFLNRELDERINKGIDCLLIMKLQITVRRR